MKQIEDILFYELIYLEDLDFKFAPVNIMLIAIILVAAYFTKRLLKRSLVKIVDKSALLERRSDTLYRLSKQFTYLVTIGLLVQSFNINNRKINFGTFLEYQILKIDSFSLSIYNILLAILLFFVSRVLLNLFKLYLNRNLAKRDWIDEGKKFTIFQLVKYLIYTITVIILVRSTGVQMSLLLTSAAALFVGVGLGLQTIFADIVSGFIMLFDGSVKVGDVVEIDGRLCRVKKINIRYTLVQTLDDTANVIPNSKLTTNIVQNRSNLTHLTRYSVKVSVAYGSDTALVKDLLEQAACSHKLVSSSRKPKVFFQDFGESGLLFEVYFWTAKDMLTPRIQSDIRFEIDRVFRENHITIPFPQRDLHIVTDRTGLVESLGKAGE